jgi:hypothetical protein
MITVLNLHEDEDAAGGWKFAGRLGDDADQLVSADFVPSSSQSDTLDCWLHAVSVAQFSPP